VNVLKTSTLTHQQRFSRKSIMSIKLVPTFVSSNIEAAAEALFNANRARPCACFTQSGEAVVCSARTARKNGWTIVARTWK
jgi:hypothetical protein